MQKTILTLAVLLSLACTIAKAATLAGLTPPGAALGQAARPRGNGHNDHDGYCFKNGQ